MASYLYGYYGIMFASPYIIRFYRFQFSLYRYYKSEIDSRCCFIPYVCLSIRIMYYTNRDITARLTNIPVAFAGIIIRLFRVRGTPTCRIRPRTKSQLHLPRKINGKPARSKSLGSPMHSGTPRGETGPGRY